MSGYLPVTMAAYEATKESGFYEKNPGREQPILQMMGKAPTENSRGVRAVNLPQLRDIQNEEFEAMLAGQQTAQQALDNAVERGNAAIKEALGQLDAAPALRAVIAGLTAPSRSGCPVAGSGQVRMHRPRRRRSIAVNARVTFPNKVLPYLLLAPQIAITLVFFFWPASQAIYQSMLREDPFGLKLALRRARQFQARARRPELPQFGAGHRRLLASSTALVRWSSRCCSR